MGFFDNLMSVFSDQPAKDAAAAQTAGLNKGYDQASGSINQGIDALKTNYTAALQPFMANYANANAGTTALGNALGLNGQGGNDAAVAAFMNNPGYTFQRDQGNAAVNAAAAASGTNASGNQLLELSKFNQGLAGNSWGQYVNSLQPFLGASNAAAGGIAGVNTGLGNAVAGQYDTMGQLGWQQQTGIGNANANADLAKYQAGNNIWKGIGAVGSMALGGMGGGLGGSIGSMIGGAVPGAVGPSSVGGAPVQNSLFSSVFSDERLKEDIEPVGELHDGQPVYKYRYIGSPIWQIGLMAQDVEKVTPEAVTKHPSGFKMVDYRKATSRAAQLSRFLEAA